MNHSEYPGTFSQWHAGEQALQQAAGSAEMLAPLAPRILRPSLSEQARGFFAQLPFVVLGFLDAHSRPWATILPGYPGFAWSPDKLSLRVERLAPDGDPLAGVMEAGMPIGVLGIELPTRRRNRVNGLVADVDSTGFSIQVQQAFGNCPKYIHPRAYVAMDALPDRVEVIPFDGLDDPEARQLLAKADTMFVASFAPGPDGRPAVDVSHRGGRPGFMRLGADGVLTIPDFSGNQFFNTLGNILLTGQAGILVPDFDTGNLLLLTGEAQIGMDDDAAKEAALLPGAERLWRVRPRHGQWLRGALPLITSA